MGSRPPRWPPPSVVVAALLAGLMAGPARVHAEEQPPPDQAQTAGPCQLPEEIEVASLVNEYRSRGGLPALEIDPRLCRAARKHSENMARQDKLAHVLDGKGPGDRAADEGFQGATAENCAGGDATSPRSFFDLWVGSAPHSANLLAFRTGFLGVGFHRTPDGDRDYYTVMFGAAP